MEFDFLSFNNTPAYNKALNFPYSQDRKVQYQHFGLNVTSSEQVPWNSTSLCGFIGYCDNSAYNACNDTAVNTCEQCNQLGAGLFLFFAIIFSLVDLLGNFVIIAVGIHLHRKGNANKMDVCRSSLAVADLLTGVQVLVVTMYNYSWSTSLTSLELDRRQLELRGSVQAFLGSFLYMIIYTSSIYHLLYMSLQRLYAITKPIRYNWESMKSVYTGLIIVWALAIISATVPDWFPQQLTCSYIVPAFMYLPTLKKITEVQDYTAIVIWVIVFYAFPYILMTISTISCGIILKANLNKKSQKFTDSSLQHRSEAEKKQKLAVVTTIGIMQLGFTITLLPYFVVLFLSYSGQLTCENMSTPYFISFYLSMCNSLVNVVVYSLRDQAFRKNAKNIFSTCFSTCSQHQRTTLPVGLIPCGKVRELVHTNVTNNAIEMSGAA